VWPATSAGCVTADRIGVLSVPARASRTGIIHLPVGVGSRWCATATKRGTVIVEHVGTYDRGGGSSFAPMNPNRVFSTIGGDPLLAGTTVSIRYNGVAATEMIVTAHNGTAFGSVTAAACQTAPTQRLLSYLTRNEDTSAGPIRASVGGSCVTASATRHLTIDTGGLWLLPQSAQRTSRTAPATTVELTPDVTTQTN
jgi:hypothetical protein